MQGLPADVRHLIYARCHVPDLLRWALVSKAWRAELRANGPWAAHVARVLYEFPEMHVFFDAHAKLQHRNDTRNRIAERPSKAHKTSCPLGVTPRGYWWVFAHVLLCPERHLKRYCAITPLYKQDPNAIAFCSTLVRCMLPKQRKLIKDIRVRPSGVFKTHIYTRLAIEQDEDIWAPGVMVCFDNGQIDECASSVFVYPSISDIVDGDMVPVHIIPKNLIANVCDVLHNFIATGTLVPTMYPYKLMYPPECGQLKAL